MRVRQNDKELIRLFGLTLKELRVEAKMSQQVLADYAELERAFISTMERGIKQPTLTTLFKLATTLQISPSSIAEILQKRYKLYEDQTKPR
jgi:transcriptional regulator with XRE-family HTH domain